MGSTNVSGKVTQGMMWLIIGGANVICIIIAILYYKCKWRCKVKEYHLTTTVGNPQQARSPTAKLINGTRYRYQKSGSRKDPNQVGGGLLINVIQDDEQTPQHPTPEVQLPVVAQLAQEKFLSEASSVHPTTIPVEGCPEVTQVV